MLYLVTGATGLVGNNMVRLLVDRGQSVRALVREGSTRRALEGLPVQKVVGDLRDSASLEAATAGTGCVIHCAAHVHIGWTGLELARECNVLGTRQVAAAARAAGARMVHVSSVDALGLASGGGFADEDTPPTNGLLCPYVVTKREAEQELLRAVDAGLDAVIVNPAYMLGPWDWHPSSGRMLVQVARGKALFAPPGSNSFCDVRDVAQGIFAAAERGVAGRRYILGGVTRSYLEAWTLFAQVAGVRCPIGCVGRPILAVAGLAGDLWARLSKKEPDINSAATAMSAQSRNFSSARAQAELGYSIRPLEETVRDAWLWFREFGYL